MKINIIYMSVILMTSSFVFAMEEKEEWRIQIPKKKELEKKLREGDFHVLVEQTQLVKRLAGQKKTPLEIRTIVDEELEHYHKYLEEHRHDNDSKIIEAWTSLHICTFYLFPIVGLNSFDWNK